MEGQRVGRAMLLDGAEQATPGEITELTPARVSAAARRWPHALALVGRDHALSYEQLVARAWAAARRLRALGVRRETCVALAAAPSPEMVLAQLAIGLAGGAYLPLDPSYPAARLRFMVEDSGALVVLDGVGLELGARRALPLAALLEPLTPAEARELPEHWEPTQASDLAYLIYTSGSTGLPKGVMVEHGSLSNYVAWKARAFGLGPGSRVSQVIAPSFDMSVWEIWPTLVSGASLHFADRADYARRGALLRWMAEERITLCVLPTPLAEAVLKDEPPEDLVLRDMLVAGDRLRTYPGRGRGFRLWNLYGPTEATINVTCGLVPEEALDPRRPPRIGSAIAGAELFVLDELGQPVAEGTPGELYIGGPVLSRGYHGRPELNAERFVRSQLASGGRLYRTGDRVRREPDGSYEFLGRIDHQVKLRGYRIELGEIEALLTAEPVVAAAVVLLQQEQLVAYVVPAPSAEPDEVVFRRLAGQLAERLPAYMVPTRWIALTALPLTPNGKIDRAELRLPEAASGTESTDQSSLEQRVARLWGETLGRDVVEPEQEFFALGGHSLAALELLERLESRLGIAAGFKDLVEAPTLAAFCARLRDRGDASHLGSGAAGLVAHGQRLGDGQGPAAAFEPFPLTDVQHAYWLGRERAFELGGVATHLYFEREGDLDVLRLERAWRRVVAAHPMLRAIVREDGLQQVLPEVPESIIQTYDYRERSDAELEAHLEAVRAELSHQVLAPGRWPLFDLRATLLANGRVRLHLSYDALILDAQSLFRLLDEWHRLYVDEGRALLPAPSSFRDYVLAWTALHDSAAYGAARRYWQARIPTLPGGPELPLARDPHTCRAHRFTRREIRLTSDAWRSLRRHAHARGLTETAALLAAYADVLAGFAKSSHFLLNLTLFNRLPLVPRVEELVGDFTSITLLEVDAGAEPEFAARAARLQRQLWRDLDHRVYSGVQVLRDCAAQRERSTAPVVFTSELGFEALGRDTAVLDRFGEAVTAITQTPQVWIDLQVMERGGALVGYWDAVEELFPPGVLDAMVEALQRKVDELAADDAAFDARTWLPDPVTARDRACRAPLGEAVVAVHGSAPLLHAGFVRQALEAPERLALIGERGALSYGELLARARRLAHALHRAASAGERLVGVVLPKGELQIVAVLAVLLAGRAYVPIEVSWPAERRAEVLRQAGIRTVLVGATLGGDAWPPGTQLLHAEQLAAASGPEIALDVGEVQPNELAYVIFTSGSTGSPKGVMIQHRAAWNTIEAVNQRFAIGPDDRALALSSLSFDLSVYDVFGLLGRGGTLVLPRHGSLRDPEHWRDCVQRHRVTLWNSVPQLAELLIDGLGEQDRGRLESLRCVLLSGDWIAVDFPERFWRVHPAGRVISLGGATEGSIWSILHAVERVAPAWTSIPYGRALPGQRLEVWDAQQRPRPTFVVGELYIGGAGVADGYLNDPERTARAFITHPETGERWYRTGDLGRYLPNGEIEFLGREDGQLKINGFRVELGEIEAALLRHPAVKACCAAGAGERGSRRLVAAVVSEQDGLGPAELRAHLERQLPEYMVPAQLAMVGELPLTSNGKVDRARVVALCARLAESDLARPAQGSESEIVNIWAELLGRSSETISVTHNFFDLGGDSVSAIRLRARLVERFRLELPVVAVFEHATVRRQAAYLDGLRAAPPATVSSARQRAQARQAAQSARSAERRGTRSTNDGGRG